MIEIARRRLIRVGAALTIVISVLATARSPAQQAKAPAEKTAPESKPASAPKGPGELDELALKQSRLADKYARLEELMARMATFESSSNPRRAELLKKAVQQSKDKLTLSQLNTIVKLLNQSSLDRALEGENTAHAELKALLELLQSENRADRLKSEQARIREYIKEVERILRLEKSIQGRTEGGGDPKDLSKEQGNIADRTGDLAKRIQENEEGGAKGDQSGDAKDQEGKNGEGKPSDKPSDAPADKPGEKPGDGKPSDGKPSEGKPTDGKPSEGKPGEGKPSEGKPSEGKPSEGKPSEGKPSEGKPSEGKPSEGKPSEGKPSEGKPSQGKPSDGKPSDNGSNKPSPQGKQPDNPARQRIQAAEERMKEAERKLAEAKRKEAVEEQERAKEELERAKAALEEILRQMREEERERMLAMLEGRFRKMLEMQLKVYEGTKRLDQIPAADRGDDVRVLSGRLGFDERKIMVEADRALTLLREEGSSIAFPETVEQMRDDMEQVAHNLSETDVGTLTQGIEEDIISALEELIEALQKAQKDMEQKKQQPQPPQPQQPQDQPLVDKIAELKMIRALQMRVNSRTKRYARLLEDDNDPIGVAKDADLRDAVIKLGDKQEHIQRITRDIVLGKNK